VAEVQGLDDVPTEADDVFRTVVAAVHDRFGSGGTRVDDV
jgi:hypothetical protein